MNFKVDKEKCIHCGLCANDCIARVLSYDAQGFPYAGHPERCIKCQHCLAICPVGAISVFDKNPDNSEKIFAQNPDMILNLIQSRRSCRHFKDENTGSEKMSKLKNMLKFIPTGCNNHKLQFSITEDKNATDAVRAHVNEKMKKLLKVAPVSAIAEKFAFCKDDFLAGEDIIFRGAPHIIVVSNSVTAPCAKEDAIIALSYFELYANSLGLGTCWCGYAHTVFKTFPELCAHFGIKEGYQPEYVMLFGEKAVNYQRCVQPEEYTINTVDKTAVSGISTGQKAKRFFWNFIR